MVTTSPVGPADDLRSDAPVYLVTGRVLAHYQSGAQTRRVPELLRVAGESFVELHPRLAARLAIEEGAPVTVTSARGSATAPARLSRGIRPDTVFMPFHWAGEASVNAVTNDAVDPVSGMPEFKVCAVSLAPGGAAPGAPAEDAGGPLERRPA
jgi:assimilatory nitrate reductase catalytic subunit